MTIAGGTERTTTTPSGAMHRPHYILMDFYFRLCFTQFVPHLREHVKSMDRLPGK